MSDEKVMALIEALGDDAKTAFIAYLICDYGAALLIVGLIAWGLRTVWAKYKEEM